MLEVTSADQLVQPNCSVSYTRKCPGRFWVSPERKSPQPSGQLVPNFQSKEDFHMFRWNFLCSRLCSLLLVLLLATTKKSLTTSSAQPPLSCKSVDMFPSQPSLLQAKYSQVTQLFLIREMFQLPDNLRGTLSRSSLSFLSQSAPNGTQNFRCGFTRPD